MAMNGDKNEVHGLDIKAFPEIYLFPALDKDRAIQYDGPREVGELHKFVHDRVSHMFTLKHSSESVKGEGTMNCKWLGSKRTSKILHTFKVDAIIKQRHVYYIIFCIVERFL